MNQQLTFPRPGVSQFCLRLLLLGSFLVPPSFGQHCPHGPIDLAKLTAGMEGTKDPNVILRSAAVAGPAAISVLRRISKPGMPLDTVPGAAQVSLAKLDDEKAMAELDEELIHKDLGVAIPKLLFVANGTSIATLLKFLSAHPDPIILGYEVDNPYDLRSSLISALADMVEYADDRAYGKHPRSVVEWADLWKHGKAMPMPLSLIDQQNPYFECLCRKIEFGFPMAMIDLAATGDPRVVPILLKLKTIGYRNEGNVGSRAPYYWWVRHDYVETALAKWGDAEEFAIIEHALAVDQSSILKLQVIGGKKAMAGLLESNTNPNYGMYNQALFSSLSAMVQDPPLPSNADATVENLNKWREWWARNKDTAKFVYPAPYE